MTVRQKSTVDALADKYFDAAVAMSPTWMTMLGIDERQDEYDDFSPAGLAAVNALNLTTVKAIDGLTVTDDVDTVTIDALKERLGLEIEGHTRQTNLMNINGIASGLHSIREVYDLMPTDTPEQWATIAGRLQAIPMAIDQWFESQLAGVEAGFRPAKRQVDILAEQAASWAKEGDYFDALVDKSASAELATATREALQAGLTTAKAAYQAAAARLLSEIGPLAVTDDAVGGERYELCSRNYLGESIDFEKYYQWGLDEVARLDEEAAAVAAQLRPGLTAAETKQALDGDPTYTLNSAEAMKQWMQGQADQAIAALNGIHFGIPEPAQTIECMIADTHDGGVWYTEPSDDFSRPGRMWWSVPESQTSFATWRELTTVYHEGVPGHHLQCSQAVYVREQLNNWRRNGIWVSGHGEGWALYAEQLMADLGFHEDPATRLGMLDGQALRAVRVVIDIGLHCGLTAPAEVGGGEWTFEKAWKYFNGHVQYEDSQARFEVLRYFGWPGQAPSYKIGQRVWEEIRDDCRRRQGSDFSLKDFHGRALSLGSLGLSTLRQALAN